MNTVPITIECIEWLGDLADQLEASAEKGRRLNFTPEMLRKTAYILRRIPLVTELQRLADH